MTLIATKATGWSTGFGNLLNKELDSWWRTRRWLVHLLLWLAVIAGFILLSKFVGITGTFLLQSLVVPAIVTLVVCRLVWGLLPGLNHFAEAIGILALHQTFYIALTLMLGTTEYLGLGITHPDPNAVSIVSFVTSPTTPATRSPTDPSAHLPRASSDPGSLA